MRSFLSQIFGGKKKKIPVVQETNKIKDREKNKEPAKKKNGFFSKKSKEKPAVAAKTISEGKNCSTSNPFKKIINFFQPKKKIKEPTVTTEILNKESGENDEKNPFFADMRKVTESEEKNPFFADMKEPTENEEKNPFFSDTNIDEPKVSNLYNSTQEIDYLKGELAKTNNLLGSALHEREQFKKLAEQKLLASKEEVAGRLKVQQYLKDELERTKNLLESALEERDLYKNLAEDTLVSIASTENSSYLQVSHLKEKLATTETLLERALDEVDCQKKIVEHWVKVVGDLERELRS